MANRRQRNSQSQRRPRYWPNPHLAEHKEDAFTLFGTLFDEEQTWDQVRHNVLAGEHIDEALRRWAVPKSDGRWEPNITWYTGLGGLAVTYLRAAEHCFQRGQAQESQQYARRARIISERCLESDRSDSVSLMCGPVGHIAVAICAKLLLGEAPSLAALTAEADPATSHTENELLFGKAGYLAAILWTRRAFEARGQLETCDAALREPARRVATALVASGVRGADDLELRYTCFGKRYAGAAHGLLGCLLVLHWCSALGWLDDIDSARIRSASTKFAAYCAERDAVPVILGRERQDNEDLVHWCHGAAGVPEYCHAALAHAHRDSDSKLAEAAATVSRLAVDIVWSRGLLLKGNGLCHGVAGNAYAFISAARYSADPKLLIDRARAFAVLLDNPKLKEAQANEPDPQRLTRGVPDSPISLMEGEAGIACFLMDLASNPAENPRAYLGFPGYGDIAPLHVPTPAI